MESFCAYHINPLGQEEGAPSLPVKCVVKFEKKLFDEFTHNIKFYFYSYPYPTCDQLADTILDVVNYFKLEIN